VSAGWVVDDRSARFDGRPVAVGVSRLKLLKSLVGADGPIGAKELARLVFGPCGDEENVRYHLRELRKELKAAFGIEGEAVANDGDGYRLVIR
jgi:DNA-binding winged helix-turn-helix (wHTH) protein